MSRKKKRTKLEREVDQELIRKGKAALKDFDEGRELHVHPAVNAYKESNALSHMQTPLHLIDDKNDHHVPRFPLTGNMRHVGIVGAKGEVIATVWNHHNSTECDDRATFIIKAVNAHEELKDFALYALQVLSDWKPDQLKAYGLDVLMEKAEAALKSLRLSK